MSHILTKSTSPLCSGTEQIKEDGMRALRASLSTTELEELEHTGNLLDTEPLQSQDHKMLNLQPQYTQA